MLLRRRSVLTFVFAFALVGTTQASGCGPKAATTPSPTAPSDATADPATPDEPPTGEPGEPEPPEGDTTVPERITVSFGSECCGIDNEAHEALLALVADFGVEADMSVPRQAAHWGREGEIDECLDLSPLTPAQRADLAGRIEAQLGSVRLVQIQYDQPCRDDAR